MILFHSVLYKDIRGAISLSTGSLPMLRICFEVVLLLSIGAASCFASANTTSEDQKENKELNGTSALIDVVQNFLFENLDSANVYLELLNKKTVGTTSRGEYLNLASTYHYYLNNWDSSIHFAKLYYDFGITTQDLKIKGDATKKLMLLYESSGDMETSDLYMKELTKLIPQVKERDQLAKIYNALGARAMNANVYTSALKHYLRIDSLYEVDDIQSRSRAIALENIGGLYINLGDATLTKEYYDRAKKMYSTMNDDEGVNSVNLQIANYYYQNNETEAT